jgi:hypothetical protein
MTTHTLPSGLTVTLAPPVLVRRSRRYGWFPELAVLANGDVVALMSAYADIHVTAASLFASRSRDGGLTWDEPELLLDGSTTALRLDNGDTVILPYYLRPRPGGIGAPCNVAVAGEEGYQYRSTGVTVTGLPRPDRSFAPELGIAGFVFNGQTLRLADGRYLATVYGFFGDAPRMSLVALASDDGFAWTFYSLIAGADCALDGAEGPCESALIRQRDGRLLCVFRLASFVPYGFTWSRDEGRTWTAPVTLGPHSVEPSLAMLGNGALALSGGRPGIQLWLNADGAGASWDGIDLAAHHNACHPSEPITGAAWADTSSYTETVAFDATTLLVSYDRIPHGWHRIPDDSTETNSVWVVRVTVETG